MSQVIQHKSRTVEYELNFQAQGETSWAFTAEGDGELFDVQLDNVASWTLNGSAVTLPFSLVNGNSYQVAVVKSVAGQSAKWVGKGRRSTNKTLTATPPDFSIYQNNRLAVLREGSIFELFDKEKLLPNNYDSANKVYLTTPLIHSVNLPTLPLATLEWSSVICYKNYYIVVAGTKNTTDGNYLYACKVLPDGSVFSLTDEANTYTLIYEKYNHNIGIIESCAFDPVSEIIYVAQRGGNGAEVKYFDANNGNLVGTIKYSSPMQEELLNDRGSINKKFYNYINKTIDTQTSAITCYPQTIRCVTKMHSNGTYAPTAAYDRIRGVTLIQIYSNWTRLRQYDDQYINITDLNGSSINPGSKPHLTLPVYADGHILQYFVANTGSNQIGLISQKNGETANVYLHDVIDHNQTGFNNCICFDDDQLFVATKSRVDQATSRIMLFKFNEATEDFTEMYLDVVGKINFIETNRLI